MNIEAYLEALGARLGQLPDAERAQRLDYYREMLEDGVEDGMSEAEAVARLGSAEALADQILREQPLAALMASRMRPRGGWSALTITLVVIAAPVWLPILLALAACLLSVYAAIWSVVAALFASAVGLMVGGVWAVTRVADAAGAAQLLMALGLGLVAAGLGTALFVGARASIRGMVALTVRVTRGVKSLLIRKED